MFRYFRKLTYWHVEQHGVPICQRRIANLRQNLDDALVTLPGIHFFLSCVTGTVSKTVGEANAETGHIRPGISYFIVFTESEQCNEQIVFAALHDSGVEPSVNLIRNRNKDDSTQIVSSLKTVLKVIKCSLLFSRW